MDDSATAGCRIEFGTLAEQLATIAGELRQASENREDPASRADAYNSRDLLEEAEKAYRLRRRRDAIIARSDLFGEPAWDILLDLYVAHGRGKRVSVSSACIGSAAPPTTGLRWLAILQEEGLITRDGDPRDHRRIIVSLTAEGRQRMESYLEERLARR